ncbi:F-box protein SKIP27-like protein [Tanacetum coccineum]
MNGGNEEIGGIAVGSMESVKKQAMGNSNLEALPQEVLVRVLCGVQHDDLRRLFFVSKTIREAVSIAHKHHFQYTTPPSFRSSVLEFQAPKKSKAACSGLNRKELANLSVALFTNKELGE